MLPSPSQSAVAARTADSGVVGVGREEREAPLEEVGVRRLEARPLGAGHGMPADEAHPGPRRASARRVDHAPLHAPGVGQDRAGREMRPRGPNEARQRSHRRAQHDQARAARRPRPGPSCPRRPPPRRSAARTAASCRATTTTSPRQPPGAGAPGDRAPDEAGADDGQARPAGRAHERAAPFPSTVRSASTSRAFSSGVPTVIRSARSRPKLAIGRTITPSLRSSS